MSGRGSSIGLGLLGILAVSFILLISPLVNRGGGGVTTGQADAAEIVALWQNMALLEGYTYVNTEDLDDVTTAGEVGVSTSPAAFKIIALNQDHADTLRLRLTAGRAVNTGGVTVTLTGAATETARGTYSIFNATNTSVTGAQAGGPVDVLLIDLFIGGGLALASFTATTENVDGGSSYANRVWKTDASGNAGWEAAYSETLIATDDELSITQAQQFEAVDFTGSHEWDDFDAIYVIAGYSNSVISTATFSLAMLNALTARAVSDQWASGGSNGNPSAYFMPSQKSAKGVAVGVSTDKGQMLFTGTARGVTHLYTIKIWGIYY